MKKATLIIGLFTLVIASTSFATPTSTTSKIADNTVITSIDGNGGQDSGGNRKVDYTGSTSHIHSTNQIADIDGNGGQDSGGNRKVD